MPQRNTGIGRNYDGVYSKANAFGEGLREQLKPLARGGFFDGCESILDIGCGQGQTLYAASQMGFRIGAGIEPSIVGAKVAMETFRNSGLRGGILAAEFPVKLNGSFDIVTSTFVLHHVAEEDKAEFVEAAMKLASKRLIMVFITTGVDGVDFQFERSLDRFIRDREWNIPVTMGGTQFETEMPGKILYGSNAGADIKYGFIVAERP